MLGPSQEGIYPVRNLGSGDDGSEMVEDHISAPDPSMPEASEDVTLNAHVV